MPKVSQALPPLGAAATATIAALDLQRLAGNQAVVAAVEQISQRALQRVQVKETPPDETLYNQKGTGDTAKAKSYGGDVSYDMVRNGDAGVTVTIRIQFLNQTRNTVPKTAASPATDPELGDLIGKPTEIPANDPDKRRDWCNNIVKEQVKPWNGKLTLVGEETNVIAKNTPKRLPVTFDSIAVFGLDEKHDQTIIVHPNSVPANAKGGNPIDAGNYYLNKGGYGGDDNVIAAHEYGHLLGIDDEYSQSNEMLNALLHRAAPKNAPSAKAALDKKTIEQMVMSSLKQPLIDRLKSTVPQVADAFRAKRPAVKAKMAGAARSGIIDAAVRTELEKRLAATSDPKLGPSVPRVVAFQTTKNFSNKTLSGEGVEAGFNPTSIGGQIASMYEAALGNPQVSEIDLAGVGKTTIVVHGSVPAMTAAGGAQQANAATAAAGTMGSAGGPATVLGLPLIMPSSGLIGQLAGLPATWGAAGSAVETGVTPTLFATKMAALVKGATAGIVSPPPGAAPVSKSTKAAALYREAHAVVAAMTKEACRQLSSELINSVVQPVLATSVKDLASMIQNEVTKVTGAAPSAVAGLGPPNPAMAALVAHMKAQLEADQKAAAGGGASPLGAGKAAPDQNVTYSVQGLMGTHGNKGLRPDQFNPMVGHFNNKLKTFWEKKFTAEVK